MPKYSETALSIFTLLNNIDELIVRSSKRKEAKKVMRALKVFADQKQFKLPQEKIDNFYTILLDSKPATLSYLLRSIAQDVAIFDQEK